MTSIIYQRLIEEAEDTNHTRIKLGIIICLFAVTGVQINELLRLKISQLQTLLKLHWMKIDHSKQGMVILKLF